MDLAALVQAVEQNYGRIAFAMANSKQALEIAREGAKVEKRNARLINWLILGIWGLFIGELLLLVLAA